ncbi:MAG: Si-specific NAD(P)(+) transhydrogenase [Steroidobacteraceae bacterium]
MNQFDVIVVGTGPAGEGAAMMLAKNHRRVAVAERFAEVGGGCTHWGTIPSKALRHAVKTLADLRANKLLRRHIGTLQVGFPELLASAGGVTEAQVAMRRRFYDRNRVPVLEGSARFVDARTLEITPRNEAPYRVTAAQFVIATGSRPYHPPGLDFSHPRVHDSDSILRYPHTPFSVTIYGAGVIGCEYASIFLGMGVKVTLINTQERLLSFLDDEITEALSYHLRDQGCIIRHNEQFEGLEAREHDVLLKLKSGRTIKTDLLLWANGRSGNTEGLGLDVLGITPNQRGQIPVDEHYRAAPGVFAVGDVIGPPALASAAYQQGSHVGQFIVDPAVPSSRQDLIPSGIYTIPEISSVGRTERELQQDGVPYEIGHTHFKSLARAQMTSQPVGMLKILFHAKTLEILGVHCFGDNASEIVHIGQTVMASRDLNNLRYFVSTTFNYPTMAEAYRIAAYNGLNRLA